MFLTKTYRLRNIPHAFEIFSWCLARRQYASQEHNLSRLEDSLFTLYKTKQYDPKSLNGSLILYTGKRLLHQCSNDSFDREEGEAETGISFETSRLLEFTAGQLEKLKPSQDVGPLLAPIRNELGGKILNSILNRLGKSHNQGKVYLKVFEWAKRSGIKLDGYHYSTVINALGRHMELSAALLLFEESKDAGVQPASYTYTSAINACVRSGQLLEAELLFAEMRGTGGPLTPGPFTYNALISALGRSGNCQRALQVLNLMECDGCSPNLVTYNSLISACARDAQYKDQAFTLLDKMQSEGVAPDSFTFNSLIRAGGRERAAQMMERAGVEPAAVTLSALVSAYSKGGQLDEALELLGKLRGARQQDGEESRVGTFAYTSLINALIKAGRRKTAEQVIEMLEEDGGQLDCFTFSALINSYANSHEVDEAFGVFERMSGKGVVPSTFTYNALINACEKIGEGHRAAEVLRMMEETKCTPDCVTYSALISAYAKSHQVENAFRMFDRMKERGVQPNAFTFNALISACTKAGGQVERAWGVLEEMQAAGLTPDVITYSALISACDKAGQADQAFKVYDMMTEAGCLPDSITYTALISVCTKAGELSRSFDLLDEMRERGVAATLAIYDQLVQACQDCGTWEEALLGHLLMSKDGKKGDELTYSALMRAYERSGQWAKALHLYRRMEQCQQHRQHHQEEADHSDNHHQKEAEEVVPVGGVMMGGYVMANMLVSTLWTAEQFPLALKELNRALESGVYPQAKEPLGKLIDLGRCRALDLRQFTQVSALPRTLLWFKALGRLSPEDQHTLPPQLAIITGLGRSSHISSSSKLKDAMGVFLHELKAPWYVTKDNKGRFVGDTDVILSWIRSLELDCRSLETYCENLESICRRSVDVSSFVGPIEILAHQIEPSSNGTDSSYN